jgi:hypothetical protein
MVMKVAARENLDGIFQPCCMPPQQSVERFRCRYINGLAVPPLPDCRDFSRNHGAGDAQQYELLAGSKGKASVAANTERDTRHAHAGSTNSCRGEIGRLPIRDATGISPDQSVREIEQISGHGDHLDRQVAEAGDGLDLHRHGDPKQR